ncbi:helix-turn-helix domain-containing protein [Bacillus thermotolerans]|uniref:helix-turn-helix domain-containing protein n=1 Tax=Bacillus thermotolerans TaxID=1221996 RepID=UPI000588FAF3|nr:RodZ family helix-turn-helix domain-containing protein [Bacillus thermotolerans]KKB44733.1 Transcriptional regulator in cluster with unspecified monosaccharide ABC transport system [Bacillus thermotolerans]
MTELGNRLREAREAKKLSLADVQEITKIQKRYLSGIEEGNYDMMPGDFYIRAFIKQYAEAVGLDAEQLFEEYKHEIPAASDDEVPQREINAEKARTTVPAEPSKLLEYLPKILVGAFIIGAVFLVWFLIPKNEPNEVAQDEESTVEAPNEEVNSGEEAVSGTPQDSEKAEEQQDPKPAAPQQEKPAAKPQPALAAAGVNGKTAVYHLKNADKFEVSVLSKGETWIGVTDGSGKSHFSGTLTNGQSQTFNLTGQKSAKVIVGYAPATEVRVNGQPVKYQLPVDKQVRQDIVIQVQPAAQ